MFLGQMRKKEKNIIDNGSNKENKKSQKVCPDYTSRLNEYREGLWDLGRSDLELEAEDTSDSQISGCHCDDLTQTVDGVTAGGRTCLGSMERRKLDNFHANRMSHPSNRGNGQCESAIFRNSMHWEEFFGSSLELAPSLLSIYDSIALATKTTEDEGGTNQPETSINSSTKQNPTPTNSPTNQHPSQAPSIRVDVDHSKCDLNHSRMCEVAGTNNNEDDNDSKKRPLSISSMSSSSSSSLPRHSHKRPNLSQFDPVTLGRSDMEKLDSLLFIDDDAPSGNTDEEMSVDTDGESGRKCDKDRASIQSSASLSSTETNENHEKSSTLSHDQNIVGTTGNANDLALSTASNYGDNCHGDQNNNSQASISFSSPAYRSFTSNENSMLSVSSPHNVSFGKSPVTTPLSRHSSVSRDSTSPTKYVTYVQRVVAEIVETERIYVRYLKEIIDGYLEFLGRSSELRISEKERACLFGNILEIYEFSRGFLEDLEQCEDDPLKVAACFVKNNEGFSIYAEYCTNYPNAIKVLTGVMMHPELSEVIKQQQITLGHNLPLGAYLLKPVQRVLKYHLLLHNLLKNYNKKDPGHEILSQALEHMTGMAQHINEMKRKHEHAVRVQEIQSQLEEYDGEDLTRLGELVLEGSFRIYGAKTSRHVFLFEKGILIAKRKEDSMLSSKGFILCSNLMLVESIPKEPLSFQIIPFDNPRGQHMLQARNLDQKRKWCQEVKRLILESYKGMIPENVKGLVMQLGKSKEEETAKPADLEPKKFHYHNVPEYLEKRQRLRRKSGGNLIADILKPQRRKNRRGESVSPRGSPTMQRKLYETSAAENTATSKDVENDRSTISRETTVSDIASLTSGDNDVDSVDEVSGVMINQSFDSAVRGQSLLSCNYDVEETDLNDVARNPDKVTRRTRSFRMATRLRPLRSVDLGEERISSSSPNTPCDNKDIDFQQHVSSSMDTQVSKLHDKLHEQNGYNAHEQCNNLTNNHHNGRLSRSDTYSSMPALSETDKDFESSVNERRDMENRSSSSSSSSRRPSNESFKSLGNFQQSKRIIDAKQYFTRDKSATDSTESFDSGYNLRRDNNTVSVLNDSFVKKSLENVGQNSPKLGPRSPKLSLSRPLPLTSSLEKTLAVKSLVKDQSKLCSDNSCDISDTKSKHMCFVYPEVSEANPWIMNCSGADLYKKPLTKRQRSHSTDCDLDETTRENLNMDWIVYANRNSLPVTGFSTDDIPKLYKYCTPPREEMDKFKAMDDSVFRDKPHNLPHQNLIKSFATPPRSTMHPANMQKYSSDIRYSLPTAMSSGESESDQSSTVGTLPTFVKKSSHIQDKHGALTRSNSTPCARVGPALLNEFRSVRTMSEDMDSIINDHEKIVAEMEDYMKKSDSNLTLNTSNSKFPTNFQVITSDDEGDHKPNRDSVASNYSSSSYESQESFENPHNDSIVDALKNKISDFKNKITHRRSGSYDNKHNFNNGQENENDGENRVRHESRSSLLSLNSWFSQNLKEKEEPDLQSVLHAGELGGSAIGQRMADPEPVYGELGFIHPLNKHQERLRTSCSSSVDGDLPSPDALSRPSNDTSTTQLPTLQNLNIQQCDSAFSIGDGCNLEDSPRTNSETVKCERRGSNSSSGSFYERRLSMAFEDGEAFRDSAVYCEMDIDHHDTVSPSHEAFSPRCQQRLPIKAYIQKLEESTKPKQLLPGKKIAREPSPMVKMKMESLQNSALYKRSVSRPASEERELKACLNRSRSRPVSEERELPSSTHQKEKDLSPLLAHLKGKEKSPKIFGSERNLSSPRSSKEREISPFSSGSKFLRSSTPCREDRPLRREQSDVGYSFRSRSSTPVSGEMKSSKSLNRLDQIGNDVESLVIMKGWVRQLIQKFQPTSS